MYPTILSRALLACCASNKFLSIALGCLIASCTAPFVISLNVTLHKLSGEILSIYAKCHAIASPSRSGSVARYTVFAAFASFFKSFINPAFPLMFIYSGSKLFSVSIPNLDLGKSLICPIEAITFVLPPINFVIVLALAGDSTIINLFAILSLHGKNTIALLSTFSVILS